MTGIGLLGYLLRRLTTSLHNLRCRLGAPPDYVLLRLAGPYPQFPPPRTRWQRWVAPPVGTLADIAADLRRLAAEPRLKGVVLDIRTLEMPLARLQALRGALADFQRSGKKVIAYASQYDTAAYYLASIADDVLLAPGGSIAPLGLRRSYTFLAESLAALGLQADVLTISAYKSAGDVLARAAMSPELRAMASWLMDDQYAALLRTVAEGRGCEVAAAGELVDHAPYTDLGAQAAGAVDAVVSAEELPIHLGGHAQPARLAPWPAARSRVRRPPPERGPTYVALIRIEGTIVDGESATPPFAPPLPVPLLWDPRAGDLSIVPLVRRVRSDRRAAAAVVYIESRGGSATASEAIAAALAKLAAEKPLIAVLGAVAASGGYYVATPAQRILSQPDTITGSIGVLAGKLIAAEALRHLRVHRQVLSRGAHADLWSDDAPFGQDERLLLAKWLARLYQVFVDRVASSRQLSPEAVDAVGRGRVWTGRQALEHGLVDELAGVDRALQVARHAAGLGAHVPLREVRRPRQPAPPFARAGGAFDYALSSLRWLSTAHALYLCPLDWEGVP